MLISRDSFSVLSYEGPFSIDYVVCMLIEKLVLVKIIPLADLKVVCFIA